MSISRVQEVNSHGSSSSLSNTFSTSSTSGDLLIAVLAIYNGNTLSSVLSGWSLAVSNNNANGFYIAMYYYPNAPSTTTVTWTLTASSRYIYFLAEYSGIKTTSPLDQTNTGTSSGTIPSGTITTVYNSSIVIAALDTASSNTWASPTNSFTLVDQANGGAQSSACYLDYVATASGSYSTSTNTADGNGIIANFLGSGATGATKSCKLECRGYIRAW